MTKVVVGFSSQGGLGRWFVTKILLLLLRLSLLGLKIALLQRYQTYFGLETAFQIWWCENVIELLCKYMNFEHISLLLFNYIFFVGSRLLFNIIIFLRASKRLPEFSGLMGKVYPGQLKPRHQIPEPRNRLIKKSDDYRFRGAGNNLHLIFVKPVD